MVCKECGKIFPTYVDIGGKKHNLCSRKYCLDCSPFGLHNTRPIGNSMKKQNTECICERCGKSYIYKRHKGGTTKNCSGCCTTLARHRNKIKMIEYKGGKCIRCGYNKCKDALCFHHRDPKAKEIDLSRLKSWNKTKTELDKCDILCVNCHMEEHERLDGVDKIIKLLD